MAHKCDENGRVSESTSETKTTITTWGHQHCSVCGAIVVTYKVGSIDKNPPIGGKER